MGFQFRKSIKFPGLKINFSKSGVSTTIGAGGLSSINVGTRGIFVNFRIPGTGISYRTKLFKKIRWKKNKIKKQKPTVQKNLILNDTRKNYAINSYRSNRGNVNNEARIFLVIMMCAIIIAFFIIFLMSNIK